MSNATDSMTLQQMARGRREKDLIASIYRNAIASDVTQVENVRGQTDAYQAAQEELLFFTLVSQLHWGQFNNWQFEDVSASETRPIQSLVDEFLDRVYDYQVRGDIRAGVRFIFAEMHRWLCDSKFVWLCEAALARVDEKKLESDLLLSFLTITRAARGILQHRSEFLERTRARIAQIRGAEVAERLLRHMAG